MHRFARAEKSNHSAHFFTIGAGSANIIVRVEKTAGKKSVGKQKRLKIAIDVEKGAVKTAQLTAAAQEKGTIVNATMSEEVESVNAADFEIRRDDDNAVIPVKSATVDSADKKKVVLETYNAMKDGKTYTVTYTAKVEGSDDVVSKAQFTATDGTVADVSVTPVTVPAGRATAVKVQELDANGVIVLENGFNATGDTKLECTISPANGYTTDDKLYLPNEGDTAVATVTYHTYKYNADGTEEGVIKKEITITAVPDTTTVTNYQMTIIGKSSNESRPAWGSSTFTANTRLQVGVPSQKAYFYIKDSNGDEITDYSDYTVASSDESKLLLSADRLDSYYGVDVTGVAAGTAYIMISKNNTVVQTLPVTVVAASKATSITLDKSSVSVSRSVPGTVVATIKDQYGSEMSSNQSYPTTYTFEVLNAPATSGKIGSFVNFGVSGYRKIEIDGNQFDAYGVYTLRATAKVKGPDGDDAEVKTTFSVNVVDVSDSNLKTTYSLAISDNTVDTTVTNATAGNAATTIKVAEIKRGVVAGYKDTIDSIVITKPDGSVLFAQGTNVTTTTNSAISSGASLNLNDVDDGVNVVGMSFNNGRTVKLLPDTGNYKVTVKFGTTTLSGNFIVKNTQDAASISVKNTDAENNSLDVFFADENKVSIVYQGLAQDDVVYSDITFPAKSVSGTSTTKYVKSIDVRVRVAGSDNTVVVNIPVNKTISKVVGVVTSNSSN